jgi:hypothetical protein
MSSPFVGASGSQGAARSTGFGATLFDLAGDLSASCCAP